MEKYKPFGRPDDIDSNTLAETRLVAQNRDLVGLPSTIVYQKESKFTPKWTCEGCGTAHIPCAQGECPICNHARPAAWKDPEQGESRNLGLHRIRAGLRGN